MSLKAKKFDQYLHQLPPDSREVILKLSDIIKQEIPDVETSMNWGIPVFQKKGLELVAVAVQKFYFSIYLWNMDWKNKFRKESKKLNLGKGCIRFQKLEQIPEDMLRYIIRLNGQRT